MDANPHKAPTWMRYRLRTLLPAMAAFVSISPQLATAFSIAFAVAVMIYGWAVLFWPTVRKGQFSLLSLFVLTLFVAIGVGLPLILFSLAPSNRIS